uniref:Lipolysis stimulated lipoprotein receptor n=1 Tax=Varanus komodoensis TaxID=61221 RepID=A0A8D2J3U0_VARKO
MVETITVLNPFNVAILFQPVTLQCNYQTTATQPPIVLWKYRSYCRSRLADAFNPSSQESQINSQLQQSNPGYNPYVECQDSSRTVRVVATKQGNTVTLGQFYQGRRITIINDADLSIEQTAWGDSGVYYCTVTSSQDLQGNNEAYAELIVLGKSGAPWPLPSSLPDWLFVVLVVLGFFLMVLLCGICWCQCCPHTCCCYVRCPCCPEKCCCPKARKFLSQICVASPAGGPHVERWAQCPKACPAVCSPAVRSGYRIQANQQDDSMRVLYYMEKELANFDPTRPGQPNGRLEKGTLRLHVLRHRGFPVGKVACEESMPSAMVGGAAGAGMICGTWRGLTTMTGSWRKPCTRSGGPATVRIWTKQAPPVEGLATGSIEMTTAMASHHRHHLRTQRRSPSLPMARTTASSGR